MQINIALEFSPNPGGRYYSDGPNSGQEFRDKLLGPAFKNTTGTVDVVFDGCRGYPTSFLDESFGGLVRELKFTPEQVLARLVISHKENRGLQPRIEKYIREA